MTEAPKRRGRPPGVKNKVKPSKVAVLPSIVAGPREDPVEPDYSFLDEAASIESYTLGPVGVKVVVRFRSAMSTPGIEHEVDWPHGWPIPQLNDVIRVKNDAGRVQFVEYDWDAGVIRISAT